MGPDGAIYIADWYNPIIQHGEVDFRDPRRDVTHGRIWRVTAKGRPLVPRPELVGAATPELLETLKSSEGWTRQQARRVLKERGRKVLPALVEWTAKLDASKAEDQPHRLEALWLFQSLDEVEPRLLTSLLSAADYRIRAAAVRVAGAWQGHLNGPLDLLAKGVADDQPLVRLEAVRALARIPKGRAATFALKALDRPVDSNIDYALWLTLRDLQPFWLPALKEGRFDYSGKTKHLVFALQAVGTRDGLPMLIDLVQKGGVPADGEETVWTMIASLGGAKELTLVFDRATSEVPAALRVPLLAALERAVRDRKQKPARDLNRIETLLKAADEPTRAVAARLAGLWKQEALRPELIALARAADTTATMRKAAVDGLTALGDPPSRAALIDLVRDASAIAPARRTALIGLATVDPENASRQVVEILSLAPDGTGASAIFDTFLQRKNGAALLTKALAGRKLPTDAAKIGIRLVRTSGRNEPALIDVLTKAGNLAAAVRKLTPEEMRQMIADVARLGDPARGEAIYRRKDQLCLTCHAIGGAGGQVGPDLSSIGASAQVDYLIESLLEPNKVVKENYHSIKVDMKDGRQFTGIKVRETETELILRTADDKEIALPRNKIDETKPGPSLMPDGLTDRLTRGELLDLVRFLSELGKIGPYSPGKARLVRRWQALTATPAARNLLQRNGLGIASGNDPALVWEAAYSTVGGALPRDELPRLEFRKPGQDKMQVAVVRCQLDVTTAGKLRLKINNPKDASLWVGQTPTPLQEVVTLDLPVGLHTLTFVLDVTARRDGFMCELDDAQARRAGRAWWGESRGGSDGVPLRCACFTP